MEWQVSTDLLVQECRELLANMEQALLQIEQHGGDDATINAIFRAAHTIKGSAGMFGLEAMVTFTHVMENVLDRVRNHLQDMSSALINCLLECGDYLTALTNAVANSVDLWAVEPAVRARLLDRLQEFMADGKQHQPAIKKAPEKKWQIDARFASDCLALGLEPLRILRRLCSMGKVSHVQVTADALPPLRELNPHACYLAYSLQCEGPFSEFDLEEMFEHFADDSDIRITPALTNNAPALTNNTSALTNEAPALTHNATGALETPALLPTTTAAGRATKTEQQALLKVEARKLDELINAVGELAICHANCQNTRQKNDDRQLAERMLEVTRLVEQVRDRSLALRMVAIGEVFQRFPRLVRTLSQELGKQVELVIVGAETELDKAMVECLVDPLLHIVRNAMDHGIESVAERRQLGKPDKGTLVLEARHQSGNVVIEIRDDGRGLNRAKILQKAIEKNLIAADAELQESDIFNLIFAPGFSTSEHITDVSGRGVGMDVVRQNLAKLNGSIDIHSEQGGGTTFVIQVPLTLAIIDGFQVAVGDSQFVLPLSLVEECLDFSPNGQNQHIFNLRGQPLPYLHLSNEFDLPTPAASRQCLVVLDCGQHRAGLVVERLVGEIQAVIKPLGQMLSRVPGFSGSTILGDGRVALLLDAPALVNRAIHQTF